MRAKVSIVGVLLALAAVVSVPGATAGGPQPQPQAQVQALANAPAQLLGSSVHRVTAQEALAAAARPGAQTDVAPSLTLGQAVGLVPVPAADPAPARRLARATAAQYCWSGELGVQWGIWPYQQVVYDHTYWCAYYGGQLTYRSTNVTHSTTLCSGSGDYTFRLEGGAGFPYAAYQVGVYFACPTNIPWLTYNFTRSMNDEVNSFGSMFTYQRS